MTTLVHPAVVEYLAGLSRLPHPELDVVAREGRAERLPIGYSTLWMATALAADGQLITLERDADRAARARAHAAAAGVGERVHVMIGDASRFLHKIAGPFDVIFQDGDKRGYVAQLDRLHELLRPGGVLAADNVLWSGEVVPGMTAPADRNPDDTKALSEYNQRLKDDPRFHTVWLPVGDGVAISTRMPLS